MRIQKNVIQNPIHALQGRNATPIDRDNWYILVSMTSNGPVAPRTINGCPPNSANKTPQRDVAHIISITPRSPSVSFDNKAANVMEGAKNEK